MTTTRKLEEIASNLDDLSLTLEEIKDVATETKAVDTGKLDEVQAEIAKATRVIEETVASQNPEK